jgi:hypothetical protein
MAFKSAALLALIGTILVTALQVWNLVWDALNVLRGVAAPVILLPSFIYAFCAFSVTAFLFVFHKRQT